LPGFLQGLGLLFEVFKGGVGRERWRHDDFLSWARGPKDARLLAWSG
jgi:hypothetical protein